MKTLSDLNATIDFTTVFLEGRLRRATELISQLTPGDFLDIGCNSGEWCLFWQTKGWQVKGIDINPAKVAQAKERGVDARLIDLSKEDMPFDDQSFDLVFAGEIIEHLVDTDGFLKECLRCLRPTGHLLITTPNLASFENRIRLLFGIYPRWVDYRLDGCGHVRAYTPRILKRQLEGIGFSVVKHAGNWVPFVPQRFADDLRYPWLHHTGTFFPGLSMSIILLARRDS